jgi:hypothetical protein
VRERVHVIAPVAEVRCAQHVRREQLSNGVRRALTIAVAMACASFVASNARAETTWIPGNSREIARTVSASRDAPVSALVFAPRVRAMAAADFAFAKIDLGGGVALRPGMAAFFELEHAETGKSGALPLPGQGNGPMLWRGHYLVSLALSAERLARRWLGDRGAIEIAMMAGHESDHVTGASFDDVHGRGDIEAGGGGEFVVYDVAMRAAVGASVDVWARVAERRYLRGAILHAPGVEGGLRWRATRVLQPLVSVFAERLFVDPNVNGGNDGGFASILAGVAVHGQVGELLPFLSIDAGNGKGLLINRREINLTVGVRFAPF